MKEINSLIHSGDSPSSPFEVLLRRLDPDRERAGERYGELHKKLIKFFEWNLCLPGEDLADKTLDTVGRKLCDEEVGDVGKFVWGVAKNIRREARRVGGRTVGLPDLAAGANELADSRNTEQEIHERMEQERRQQCLRCCLGRMRPADREMFMAYHNAQGAPGPFRLELAKSLGLAHGAMRTRVSRLRDEVEKCVRQCASSLVLPYSTGDRDACPGAAKMSHYAGNRKRDCVKRRSLTE